MIKVFRLVIGLFDILSLIKTFSYHLIMRLNLGSIPKQWLVTKCNILQSYVKTIQNFFADKNITGHILV